MVDSNLSVSLEKIVSKYPHISHFISDQFIQEQEEKGLRCFILKRLNDIPTRSLAERHLPYLETLLTKASDLNGYERLGAILRRASDWDQHQEFIAQVEITLCFKKLLLVQEIESELPHRKGSVDIKAAFDNKTTFCEITSLQSLEKSLKSQISEKAIQQKINAATKRGLHMSEEEAKEEIEDKNSAKVLLEKTKKQLPQEFPGFLAVETL
jgi:hypothetical protein